MQDVVVTRRSRSERSAGHPGRPSRSAGKPSRGCFRRRRPYGRSIVLAALLALASLGALTRAQPVEAPDELRVALARAGGRNRLDLLGRLARCLEGSGTDEALRVAEEARALARTLGDQRAEGHALISLAATRRARAEYALALDAGSEALAMAQATGDLSMAARAHNVLGIVENSRDEPAAALRHGLEERRLFEGLGDRRGLAQSLNNLGNSYRRLGDYARALEYHQRSLALKTELEDRDGAGYSHHNIGEVYSARGEHESALAAFTLAEEQWRSVGNLRAVAAALKSQGLALEALGRLDEALVRQRASLALRRSPPNPHGEAETLAHVARLLLRLGRPAEAAAAGRQALAIAERLQQTSLQGDVLAGLMAAETARGDPRAARRMLEKQVALLQRAREQEVSRLRSEMHATLEADAARRRAERLEQDAALKEEALRRGVAERNLALVAAMLLLATAGMALNGYRLKRASGERYRRQAIALEAALARVRTLSGLLPLCGWCHVNVHDSTGEWVRLETYVQEHTDARVTHGICPSCREAHFPTHQAATGPEHE